MKTINVDAHALTLARNLSSSTFVLHIEGLTPGRKLMRVKIKCDGPLWIEEFARELHSYIQDEQKKLDQAKAAMKGTGA